MRPDLYEKPLIRPADTLTHDSLIHVRLIKHPCSFQPVLHFSVQSERREQSFLAKWKKE